MTPAASYRVFGLLLLASLVAGWRALFATAKLALQNDGCTYILLIVPISVVLIVLLWRSNRWQPEPCGHAGLVLLICAAAIGVAGAQWGTLRIVSADSSLTVEMLALVVWWLGSYLFCFGASVFRGCVFPLFFLLLAVPLPGYLVTRMAECLQQGTALSTRVMLSACGVPVTQHGTILTIPGLSIEVAQECSSIRSSTLLVVCSIVMAYALLRSSVSRVTIVVVAMVLAVLKNGLRVFTLMVLTRYADPGILDSRLHRDGGFLFFLLGLAGVVVAIWVGRRLSSPGDRIEIPPLHRVTT